jgi:hypothetical protein
MARANYKGKRLTVTMPDEVFTYIETLASQETRTNSQAALVLLQEAIAARELRDSQVITGS